MEIFKFEEEDNFLLHLKTVKHELLPRYLVLLFILQFISSIYRYSPWRSSPLKHTHINMHLCVWFPCRAGKVNVPHYNNQCSMRTPLRNNEMLRLQGEMLFRVIVGVEPHHFPCCPLPSEMTHHPTNTCPIREEQPALHGVWMLCKGLIQSALMRSVVATS